MGGITKSIGGISKVAGVGNAVAAVTRGMNITPVITAALGTIAESGDQRAAFNGLLLATAANVMKKPNFNLELEINDLFIRLGNLRGMQTPLTPAAADSLSLLLHKYDELAKAMIQNMR